MPPPKILMGMSPVSRKVFGAIVAVSVSEARPLHSIQPQQIDTLAQSGKSRVDVGVRVVVVGEDRSLLCLDPGHGDDQKDKVSAGSL